MIHSRGHNRLIDDGDVATLSLSQVNLRSCRPTARRAFVIILASIVLSMQALAANIDAGHGTREASTTADYARLEKVSTSIYKYHKIDDSDLAWWLAKLADRSLLETASGKLLRLRLLGNLTLFRPRYTSTQVPKVYRVAHLLSADNDWGIRQLDVYLLGELRDPRAAADLASLQQDKDHRVASTAQQEAKRRNIRLYGKGKPGL